MNWELELAMTLGYAAAIGGQWLVAKKSRSGFGWGLGANAIWVGIGFYLASVSMVIFSTLWMYPNWRGLRDWAAPPRTRSSEHVTLYLGHLSRVRKYLIRLLAGCEISEES